jgi:calcium/calmodulin-dependent protein kinase I
LGAGGYSVVHEASSKQNGARVAVKITDKARLSKIDEESLRQEITILQTLNHDNIVKFVNFFEESSSYFVILELLEGGELFDRIVKKQCYNEKEARDLVFVLLSAIKYCHDLNIVHRYTIHILGLSL